jgi:hypothetical protein
VNFGATTPIAAPAMVNWPLFAAQSSMQARTGILDARIDAGQEHGLRVSERHERKRERRCRRREREKAAAIESTGEQVTTGKVTRRPTGFMEFAKKGLRATDVGRIRPASTKAVATGSPR